MLKVNHARPPRWQRLGLSAGVALTLFLALLLAEGFSKGAFAQPLIVSSSGTLVPGGASASPSSGVARSALTLSAPVDPTAGLRATISERGAATVAAGPLPVLAPSPAPALQAQPLCNEQVAGVTGFLSTTTSISNQPSSSRTGRQLAFWSTSNLPNNGNNADGNIEIFLINLAGGAPRRDIQLTSSSGSILGGFNLSPSISDDGSRIAFFSDRDLDTTNRTIANRDSNFEIFFADVANGEITRIFQVTETTRGGNILPSISADGSRIAFASDDNPNGTNPENNQEIFVATILSDTIDLIQVTDTGSTVTNDQPVLSGNAERVVFTSNRDEHGNIEIFRADVAEGSDVVQVTYTIDGIINDQPAVDEFGNTIAFVSNGAAEEIDLPTATAGNLDVFVASIGQTGEVAVTPVTSTQLPSGGDPPTSEQPSISADGTRVAFTSNGDFANNNPDVLEQIFVYDTFFGEEISQLTRSRRDPRNPGLIIFNDQPSISGDSATVTFVSNRNGNRDLYQTICPFADLAVTIGASQEVTAGNSLTYNYTVTNYGPVTATNIVVTDTIPVGTNFNGPASPGWSCTGQQCTYAIGTLSGEEEESVGTLVIDVPSNRQDGVTLTNSIQVGSTVLDRNTINNFDSIITTVTRRSSLDMTIAVSADPILPGSNIIYTLVLSNAGPSDAFNIVMTDTIPLYTTFQSASGGGTQVSPREVRWTVGNLQAGTSIQRTVTVAVDNTLPGGVNFLQNSADALDEDGNTAPASLSTSILAEPQLDLEKTTPTDPVEPDDLVQYTLSVDNTGNQAATGVVLTDRLPAFTAFAAQTGGGTHDGSPEGGVISWSLGTIPANSSVSRTVTVRVRQTVPTGIDTIINDARVADDGRNADSGVISDTDTLASTLFAEPNFSLVKQNSLGQVEPGDTIPYQITLTNLGNQDATGIVISDTLPPETSFISASTGGTHDGSSTGGQVTWLPFDLAAGANRTFTVSVQIITPVPQGANDIINTANAQDDGVNSSAPISATDTFVNDLLAGPSFTLSKSDGLDTVVPGQTTTYTIRIQNDGNQGATNVALSDTLPISNSVAFIGATGNITPSGGTLTWPLFDLASGAARQFTVTVMITSPAPINVNEIVNYAAAADDGANSEGVPVTASVSDTNTLDAAPTLSIIKTDSRTQVMPDERVTYDITVSNNGNQAAGGVVVTDTLPLDTIYVAGSASPSGSYITASHEIVWPIGTLVPGQTVTHTFALTTENPLNLTRLINVITVDDDGANGPDASDTFTETNTLVRSLIGGLVWEDVNANGIQDVGEPGIPNVVVNLPTAGSAPANRTTTTDANGVYTFTNVVQDNDYVLEFERPVGFLYTLQDATNDQQDSDADPVTGLTDPFSVMNPARLDFSRDAGFYRAVTIGDYVWEDEDGDGVQDGSEPPLPAVLVTLYDDLTNSPVLSTTTDLSGTYSFNDVVPGTYYIRFTAPISYTFAFRDRGGDDTLDNDADATGETIAFTVASGETTTIWDAGLYKPIVIGNLVWEDLDGDGLQDLLEPGIPNITVTLYHSPTNALARTTTTIADGTYIFVNLSPGYYYAEFTEVPPYALTTMDVGMDDTIDSDADPITGRTNTITVRSGEIVSQWDAGMFQVTSVGDYVWEDVDGDGIQDGGEPPLAGATVALHRVSDGMQIATDVTDANGAYSFTNVPPTNYYLDFTPPGGYFLTQRDQGGDDNLDSDPNPTTGETANFLLTSAQTDNSRDAGMYRPATVGDYVWVDLDADGVQEGSETGLQNVTVHVRRASDNVSVGNTTTNASGNYTIGNIPPGNYYVQFTPPGGFLFTTQDQGSDSTDSDANIVTGRTATFTLITNQTVDTWDAGLFRTATVSDFVWEDLNGNGIQGGSEPGVGGVTIGLYRDVDDTLVMTTTSAANGSYVMTNIRPDTYYLHFTPTVGYFLTQKDQGGNDANDSDPDPLTGQTDPFSLISNESNSSFDAGVYQLATVGNRVWEDRDGDGIQEGGEPGIPGATAILRRASDNSIVVTDTTGLNGLYSLPGGVSGVNYYVEFILPPTYSFTQQDQGGDDNLDSDPNPATGRTANFTLTSNQIDNSRDAGAYRPATVGDFVWQEISYDGVQDVGELGVAGVQVSIRRSSDNGVAGSDTTDANGAYSIGNVPPGSYYLVFTPPANAAFTFQDATTDTLDSDVNLLGQTAVFSVLSNEVTTDWDAGLIAGATIGDYVWEDDDGDGIQDGGESGLAGAIVSLHLSLDDSVVATDTTDANGIYTFANLQPNSYYLVFTPPGGYLRTQQNQGGDDAVDSDADPATGQTSTFLISLGQVTTIWDAGMYLPAVVGNRVWRDTDDDGNQDGGESGVSGATVGLYRSDTTFVATATTDGSGNYSFGGLTSGDYYLVFTPTVGLVLTHRDVVGDGSDSDPDQLTRRTATFNLAPGETDNTWDAGLVTPASIGNRVWEDTDGDGIQDGSETGGVPGVTVNLHRLSDGLLAGTATTDANGNYTISNVPPADNGADGYYLDFILPGGYFFTLLDQGGDGTVDSDANQTTGESEPLELDQGENATNWDAGAYRLGTVGNRVWDDTDGDGIQDAGETTNISGVTVNVRRTSDNGLLGTATTNASGNYAIGNLIPGVSYYVEFVLPGGGYLFAPANQGGDDTVDSDPNTGTGRTANFTINSNQTDNRWDAGMFRPATISDRVWEDTNVNGIQDVGELGIATVTVRLRRTSDNNVLGTTTTNASGIYSLSGTPGVQSYLEFTLPGGYFFTLQDQGGDDTLDSDPNTGTGRTANFTPTSNQTDTSRDAGMYRHATISDRVWEDMNGNGIQDVGELGIQNVSVRLRRASDNASIVGPVTTNASGNYSLTSVPPGVSYYVEFTLPGGYQFTLRDVGADDAVDSDANPADGRTSNFTPTSNQTDTSRDAGMYRLVTISDFVWEDMDGDGIQDGGETTDVTGVTVNVRRVSNDSIAGTDLTDSNGYSIQVAPGSYYVEFVLPGGYNFSPQDQGGNDATDSDPNLSGITANFAVTSNQTVNTWDAGMFRFATIGNFVWDDTDDDGRQDGGEPGVAGVTVELRRASDNSLLTSGVTNPSGNYSLNAPPGVYYIVVIAPMGRTFTTQDQPGGEGADSDVNASGQSGNITLDSNEVDDTWDAGFATP